ncbi:MAG: phosphoribosylformylglycinamidine synthase subunit PurL [Peptococcaceae bacterium]|nr:phosphoribosylformylglycinamidine synthase subunit PurL [Peptococcaceae bacterium]
MQIQEVRVTIKSSLPDAKGEEILEEIKTLLGTTSIDKIRTAKVYRFEGITSSDAEYLAKTLLCEDVFQEFQVNGSILADTNWLVEVAYKPGVMNPEAASLIKSARDLGIRGLEAADSSIEYAFYGKDITAAEIAAITEKILVNATIQQVITDKPDTLKIKGIPGTTSIIPIREMNDEQLMALSRQNLFLNLEEMRVIQNYFRQIQRDPTDCEIEVLAQTWSEHCVHKTFKSGIVVNGQMKKPFFRRLQEATREIDHPLVLSAFEDNSGVLAFYEGWAVCGKVETHNSPSAIEPYGGAATGSGGVFRDIMGTGQGAKVIASTDMFCFAPPDLSPSQIPEGCLHPRYLLRRVVAGVRDYGNRMGIPTNNGSLHFHFDFRAKPTVIVGAYGLLPAEKAAKGEPLPGDLVVVVGGRTGRDGIHGATFSSAEMTDQTITTNAQAVQIGHPIEEKRMSDALQTARDKNLIRAITDCGAGGFASAVGEMGRNIGVEIALERAPLKYSGLAPWEILLSESQERMVMAIAPENLPQLTEICRQHNVELTVLGTFTGSRRFVATFNGDTVLDLDMDFLHNGLPQQTLEAEWKPVHGDEPAFPEPADLSNEYTRVLAHLNVCSKEPVVRQYDHGVQGTNAILPYGGVEEDAPNDAIVITPLLDKPYGLVISHGMNPVLNRIDPYWGGLWAATEAVANAVAVGANPRETALIDNFIWPVPDCHTLGALDLAVDACVDFSRATGMPFISGKDSLSSTYRSKEGTVIQIPPVLCISAFGRIPDVRRTVSSDLKKPGNLLVLVGTRITSQMAGSVYFDLHQTLGHNLPRVNLKAVKQVFNEVFQCINSGMVQSCHDISEGGLAACLAEMCFGGRYGAEITIPDNERPDFYLFNETPGCFLVEVDPAVQPEQLFKDVPAKIIGKVIKDPEIRIYHQGNQIADLKLDELLRAWQRPMKEVFGD